MRQLRYLYLSQKNKREHAVRPFVSYCRLQPIHMECFVKFSRLNVTCAPYLKCILSPGQAAKCQPRLNMKLNMDTSVIIVIVTSYIWFPSDSALGSFDISELASIDSWLFSDWHTSYRLTPLLTRNLADCDCPILVLHGLDHCVSSCYSNSCFYLYLMDWIGLCAQRSQLNEDLFCPSGGRVNSTNHFLLRCWKVVWSQASVVALVFFEYCNSHNNQTSVLFCSRNINASFFCISNTL